MTQPFYPAADFTLDLTPRREGPYHLHTTAADGSSRSRTCWLNEATEEAASKFRAKVLGATRLGPDGKPSHVGEGLAEAESLLVSLCLVEEYEQAGEVRTRPVPLVEIRKWPYRTIKRLFDRAKAISDLDDAPTEESLTRRIGELQEQLDKVKAGGKEGADPVKN